MGCELSAEQTLWRSSFGRREFTHMRRVVYSTSRKITMRAFWRLSLCLPKERCGPRIPASAKSPNSSHHLLFRETPPPLAQRRLHHASENIEDIEADWIIHIDCTRTIQMTISAGSSLFCLTQSLPQCAFIPRLEDDLVMPAHRHQTRWIRAPSYRVSLNR
jgi:hypothetical protein